MHKQQTNYSFFFSEAIFKQHSVNWKYNSPTLLSCCNVWSSISWVYHVSRPIMIIVTQHNTGGSWTHWWYSWPLILMVVTSWRHVTNSKSINLESSGDITWAAGGRSSASPDDSHCGHLSLVSHLSHVTLSVMHQQLCHEAGHYVMVSGCLWLSDCVLTGHRPVTDCAHCPADLARPGRVKLCTPATGLWAAIKLWPRA